MSNVPLMKCGHAANAINEDGKPCCVICVCISNNKESETEVSNKPDLENRKARCIYYKSCSSEQPSSLDLAFFEYRGLGSKIAYAKCHKCGYFTQLWKLNPDGKDTYKNGKVHPYTCRNKGEECEYGPYDFDRYYCGCLEWC